MLIWNADLIRVMAIVAKVSDVAMQKCLYDFPHVQIPMHINRGHTGSLISWFIANKIVY